MDNNSSNPDENKSPRIFPPAPRAAPPPAPGGVAMNKTGGMQPSPVPNPRMSMALKSSASPPPPLPSTPSPKVISPRFSMAVKPIPPTPGSSNQSMNNSNSPSLPPPSINSPSPSVISPRRTMMFNAPPVPSAPVPSIPSSNSSFIRAQPKPPPIPTSSSSSSLPSPSLNHSGNNIPNNPPSNSAPPVPPPKLISPRSNTVSIKPIDSSSPSLSSAFDERKGKSIIFSSGKSSSKNVNFVSPFGPGLLSTDTFNEEKISESFKNVEMVNNMMKDVEKRMSKMYAAAQALSAESQALSTTLKKYAIETKDSENVMMKEMGTALGRLSEVFRYVEVIREGKIEKENEGNVVNFIDLIAGQMKNKKKKLDELGNSSFSLSKKIAENMKKKAVNVVKFSEHEKEREDINRQYYKVGPEIEAEFDVNSDIVCWKALERFCATAESHQKFYSNASDACNSIVPDIERSKQRIIEQRSELTERLKSWTISKEEGNMTVDISLKSTDDNRLCLLKAIVAEDRILMKNLRDLVMVYAKDIWTDSTLWNEVDKKDVAIIFGDTDVLFNLHSSLLEQFESAVREWPSKTLSSVRTESSFGTSYIRYLYRLPQAVQTLTRLRQDSKALQHFFKSCEKKCDNGMDIMSLITLPCKHIGKYADIFRKYLAEPNTVGEDDSRIHTQLDDFGSMAVFMSQIYARSMSLHVRMLLSGLVEDESWNVREYFMEGTMSGTMSGSSSKNDYQFFLFSDILLYAKKSSDSKKPYRYVGQFELKNMTVKDTPLGGDPDSFFLVSESGETSALTCASTQLKSQWMTEINRAKLEQNQRRVFGIDLKTLMATKGEKGRDIPSFIDSALERLTDTGMEKEGIFRLSGNRKEIEHCKVLADSGTEVDFKEKDTHTITGFVKMWIRDLPSSLIPENVWDQITRDDRVPVLKQIFEGYSNVYERNTLQAVMKVLHQVTLNHEVNKMQSGNLSIVFGPLLFRDSSATDLQTVFPLISKLIDNYDAIFSGIEAEREKGLVSTAKRDRRKLGFEPGKRLSMRENTGVSDSEMLSSTAPPEAAGLSIGLAEIVKQGQLSKKGAKRRNWKDRWFVLKVKYLYYFANRKDPVSKGVITLVNATVSPSVHDKKDFCFSVNTKDREFLMCAKSETEMKEWMEAIRSCNRAE